MKHGYQISWSEFGGAKTTVTAKSDFSLSDAAHKAFEFARECGWTEPRWWQWWRWREPIRRQPILHDMTKEAQEAKP